MKAASETLVMVLLVFAECTIAQQPIPPTITLPVVASWGEEQGGLFNVREVDIAVHGDTAMVVFIQDGFKIGYSYNDGTGWTEGVRIIDDVAGVDPSIAYVTDIGTGNDGFVCVYKAGGKVLARKFDPHSVPYLLSDRIEIRQTSGGSVVPDKPWMVAGYSSPTTGQHLHAVWFEDWTAKFYYGFSDDGGSNWQQQRLQAPTDLSGGFCGQIAVGDTSSLGPVYVVYNDTKTSNVRWKFLEGNGTGSPLTWSFDHLRTSSDDLTIVDLTVTPNFTSGIFGNEVPGRFAVKHVPYLVADPSDSNRLYLVYHDAASSGSTDIDVFCRTLSRPSPSSPWSVGSAVRVNNDLLVYPIGGGAPIDRDQLLPAAVVDDQGRVHIVFYDDRHMSQPDSEELDAEFDVYYAVSTDGGASFTNIRLASIPYQPSLEVNLTDQSAGQFRTPGEYPAIACDGNTVWVAFAGTSVYDPRLDKSVILVGKIEY